MKKFKTLFVAAMIPLLATVASAQTTLDYTNVSYSLLPEDYASATATLMFGYGMDMSNDTLFVSACGNGGRYVNVYKLNEDLTVAPTLLQQLSNADDSFFGYSVSKDGEYLAVTASTAKMFYLYKKNSSGSYESFYSVDVTTLITDATIPQVSMHGKYVLLTTQKAGVAVLKIDEENSTVSIDYASENIYSSVGLSASDENLSAYITAGSNKLVIIERDEETDTYSEQSIDFEDGITNHSGVDIENGVIAVANVTTSKLHLIEKDSDGLWSITHTADAPETDNNATFGYNVDFKNGYILVTSNYSSSTNGSSYVYYLSDDELSISCEIVSTADDLNMGSGGAFNGTICAISNSNYISDGASYSSGIVYIFDLSDILGDQSDSIDKVVVNQSITDGKTYDLNGREVINPTRGMFIRNGRLLLLK